MKQVDPNASWQRLVATQEQPSRELFDSLFAVGARDQIICATLPLIRRYNNAPKAIREDVKMFVLGEITREVDRLLQHPNANAGSYLIDCCRHAVHAAKFGTGKHARDCVSSGKRIYRPRKRKSDPERDALILKLEKQGCSSAMRAAELRAAGFDESHIVETESQWPMVPHEETGESILADFGAPQPAVDDRWELLEELCDETEQMILDLLSRGHSRHYVAKAIGCHETTVTKTVNRIRAKVRRHERET